MNDYEQAIVSNAQWFVDMGDENGFIAVPADEYYGVTGDASLVGHAMSVRTWGWALTEDACYRDSALRSARWLAERQDERGGWRQQAGYALDAAQCVLEGFCTFERLTGDRQFHDVLVKAADRMLSGTVRQDGTLAIGNLLECGEYAHFGFLAWKQTGLERHCEGAKAILQVIMDNFDEQQGYWSTAVEPEIHPVLEALKPCLTPILRSSVARFNLKGKTIAKLSEQVLPLVMRSRGPQYSLGMMDAESILDTLDGSMELPGLREQTRRAIVWVETHCRGPVDGSLVESRKVPAGKEVYPLAAINDTDNASLWPTAAYLLALVGMNEPYTYRDRMRTTADWIVSMQDTDGGFWTHMDADGRRFGEKYGNINYYASMALRAYVSQYPLLSAPAPAERAEAQTQALAPDP
jgi:hypothetical protein